MEHKPTRGGKRPEWKTWSFWIAVGSLVVSGIFGYLTYRTNQDLASSAAQSAEDSHSSAIDADKTLQLQSEPILLLACDWIPDPDNGTHEYIWRRVLNIGLTQSVEIFDDSTATVTQIGPITAYGRPNEHPSSQPSMFFNCSLSNHGPLPLINVVLGDFTPYFLTGPTPRWVPGKPGSIGDIPVLEHGDSYTFSILNTENVTAEVAAPTSVTMQTAGGGDRFSSKLILIGITGRMQDFKLSRFEMLPPPPKAPVSPRN